MSTIKTTKGLPGKSYIYLIELDVHLNQILSYLCRYDWFNTYISSLITYRYKYNDRQKQAISFTKFLITPGNDRIKYLHVFTRRSVLIKYLYKLYTNIDSIDADSCTKAAILNCFPSIHELQKTLVSHYTSFAVKHLLLRRKGDKNPNVLKGDAYESIIDAIDNYNPSVSKIPFNKFLNFYIRNKKNVVIQNELWGLKEGSLVSSDCLDSCCIENDTSDNLNYLDRILHELPLEYKRIVYTRFKILDPLSSAEKEIMNEIH